MSASRASRVHSPSVTTGWLLLLFLVGLCSRLYGLYNQALKADPSAWTGVLRGSAAAPEQYRIGVIFTAAWLSRLLPLRLSQSFALLDLAGSLLAAWLLYRVLLQGPVFQRSGILLRWFGSLAFVALLLYYLDWTMWYPRVATLPTTGLVAAALWLWTPSAAAPSRARSLALAVALVGLSLAQALVRADVALCLNLGMAAACLLVPHARLSLPRGAALAISLLGAAVAAATQLYLSRVAYPHATYEGVPMWMLLHDYRALNLWVTCFIFVAPFLWTAASALRGGLAETGAGGGFLLAGLAYLALWLLMGRLDEVRIFLPVAVASVPLTVSLAMRQLQGTPGSAPEPPPAPPTGATL